MMRVTRSLFGLAFAAALGIAPSMAAETTPTEPAQLTNSQLDHVTAGGIALGASANAVASGGLFALTEVNIGGASGSTSLPGGGSLESGAIVGAAVGYSPGGIAGAGVTTSGTVSGASMTISTSGGAVFPGGQAALSGTFVSGGPTFLP